MSTLLQLRNDLRGLAGLKKVTEDEADALLNEGHRELCVDGEWTRANLDLGPTVADQAAYTLPTTVDRPLKVWVNDKPYDPSDENEVKRIIAGELRLRRWGVFWLSFDEDGVESVSVYPTPSEALSLTALCVVYPDTLTASDSTRVPLKFDRYIRDYAASQIYGFTEDNVELREYHEGKFKEGAELLRRRRFSRTGRGGVRARIEGVTA